MLSWKNTVYKKNIIQVVQRKKYNTRTLFRTLGQTLLLLKAPWLQFWPVSKGTALSPNFFYRCLPRPSHAHCSESCNLADSWDSFPAPYIQLLTSFITRNYPCSPFLMISCHSCASPAYNSRMGADGNMTSIFYLNMKVPWPPNSAFHKLRLGL